MDMDFNMDVDEPPKLDTRFDPFDDDFDIPEDIPDWEVLSQLSVDDSGPLPPKPAPITSDTQRQQNQDSSRDKVKEDSPPLIATLSPAKRGLTKRLPNLKAPRAGESSHLGISEWSVSKSSSQAESAQNLTSMSKRGRQDLKNGDDYAKKEKKSDDSAFSAKSRSVSPERVVIKQESNEASRYKRQQEEVMDSDDDFTTSPVAPVFVLSDSNKKYTFGSQREEHSRRERSRSGSVSCWIEEDSRPKKDQPTGMVKVKTEPGLGISDHDTGLGKVKQEPTDEGLRSTLTMATSTSIKTVITSRTGSERAIGSSVHAAIDLLSDDDDEDNDDSILSDPAHGFSSGYRSLHSPMKRIKTEPGSAIAAVTTVDLVAVKKEEVMLEFDMDDDDDFGCLNDLTKETPLVPLEEVKSNIDNGREVRTKVQNESKKEAYRRNAY